MSPPTLYRLPVAHGTTAAGIYLGAVAVVASIVLVSIWVTTQVAAYRLRFHPVLGAPLVVVESPYRELLGPAAMLRESHAHADGGGQTSEGRSR